MAGEAGGWASRTPRAGEAVAGRGRWCDVGLCVGGQQGSARALRAMITVSGLKVSVGAHRLEKGVDGSRRGENVLDSFCVLGKGTGGHDLPFTEGAVVRHEGVAGPAHVGCVRGVAALIGPVVDVTSRLAPARAMGPVCSGGGARRNDIKTLSRQQAAQQARGWRGKARHSACALGPATHKEFFCAVVDAHWQPLVMLTRQYLREGCSNG